MNDESTINEIKSESYRNAHDFSEINEEKENLSKIELEKEIENFDESKDSSSFNYDANSLNNISFISNSDYKLLKIISFIYCKKCTENFFLKFQRNCLNIECGCKLIQNCSLEKFIKDSFVNDVIDKRNLVCQNHNLKYIKYCVDCGDNLCEQCLKEETKYNNDINKIITKHETHTTINLLNKNKKIKKIKNILGNQSIIKTNIKNLINALIENYEEYPSYNIYLTIKNIKKMFGGSNDESNHKNLEKKTEEFLKINTIEGLMDTFNNHNKYYKIKIEGKKIKEKNEEKENEKKIIKNKETMIDLSMFQGKEFKALQVIKINSVKLKNISALSSSFLPQLKRLDLEENEITDDCINVFNNLKLPKIIFLSLFDNKITSPEIFESIKQYDSLKTFFIGINSFEKNKTINSDKIYELNQNLEELGITDNFTTETNEFITNNLRLENLKILYITSNGFTTFKPFENIHFKKIEQIWARGDIKKGFITDITEINYFNRKEKIKQINLKKNKINNIEKLPSIIKNFPKLKILNVEDNNIDYDKIKYVQEEIKKLKDLKNLK